MTGIGAHDRLRAALQDEVASNRLQAAMAAGTHPRPAYIPVLLDRCAIEPDFSVREMLTWALIRQDREATTPAVVAELGSPFPQARSQGLHTLSKIGDPDTRTAITTALLTDEEDEVARAAWRAAAGLAADDAERLELARTFATQWGRGGHDVQRSLSRALAVLGPAADGVIAAGSLSPDLAVQVHARATAHLIENPHDGFETALFEARRQVALGAAPELDD